MTRIGAPPYVGVTDALRAPNERNPMIEAITFFVLSVFGAAVGAVLVLLVAERDRSRRARQEPES